MVVLSPFVCAYCRKYSPTVVDLCRQCHAEESRWTDGELERTIDSQRESMPGSPVHEFARMPPQPQGRPSTIYDLPPGYERSESAVLEPLIDAGTGGFTRALMAADAFLRSPGGRACQRATANAEQTEVTLHFATFEKVFTSEARTSRWTAKQAAMTTHARSRMLLVRYLGDFDEPQYLSAIMSALKIDTATCRYLIKSSNWFSVHKSRPRRFTRYGLTPLGRARLAMQLAERREAVSA